MKTKEDLHKWVKDGLVEAAFYWYQTYGFPVQLFQEEISTRCPTLGDQMNFLNNLYKKGILKRLDK